MSERSVALANVYTPSHPQQSINDFPITCTDVIDGANDAISLPPRNKYGNMKILLQTDRFLITLGPDYLWFLTAYTILIITGIFIIILVNNTLQNLIIRTLNIIIIIGQCIVYLSVAVSNPGIVLQQNLTQGDNDTTNQIHRYCRRCNLIMKSKTSHCKSCDVCIRQYDHHCPWVSKCIGAANLHRYYFFLISTLIFIIYCLVIVLVCITSRQLSRIEHQKGMSTI